jgi:spore coat polysaccharide biosynthesis protein SpsF (cytidylyltransferase family)
MGSSYGRNFSNALWQKRTEKNQIYRLEKKHTVSKKGILEPKTDEFKDVRLTVDEIEDFNCIKMLIERFGIDKNWKEYAKFVIENPKLFNNQGIQRNEGFSKSLLNDKELNNG